MKPCISFSRIKAEKLGHAAVLACLLITAVFIAVLNQGSHPMALLSLQLSIHAYMPYQSRESGTGTAQSSLSIKDDGESHDTFVGKDRGISNSTLSHEEVQKNKTAVPKFQYRSSTAGNEYKAPKKLLNSQQIEVNEEVSGNGTESLSPRLKENLQVHKPDTVMDAPQSLNNQQEQNHTTASSFHEPLSAVKYSHEVQDDIIGSDAQAKNFTLLGDFPRNSSQIRNGKIKSYIGQENRLTCDFSEPRSDTCAMTGDIRVLSSSHTILLANSMENTSHVIRPYARKWEPQLMQYIKELTLKTSAVPEKIPSCSLNHSVPAVILSTGGFLGNFFHDFTDMLIPLYVSSHHFNGEVQFIATDFNAQWISKYKPILQRLSRFEIINMDTDKNTHCFPSVRVGLMSHKVLGIDPSKTPNNYSMTDFKKFVRETFRLKRGTVMKEQSGRKPRLLMILRKGSRSLLNEKQVIKMARRIGYKVIAARPDDMKELRRFAEVVNSCDVMVGVHGAGLTNMVFLPENSTVIQIIPWGGLTWACRHDFGEPAPDMGIKYLEYEIKEEESSLIKQYPRNHAVFRDPLSVHKQGWNSLWSIFLDKQKIQLDIPRFRGLLLEVYQSFQQ